MEKFNKDAVRKNSINNDSIRMDSPGKSRVGSKNWCILVKKKIVEINLIVSFFVFYDWFVLVKC